MTSPDDSFGFNTPIGTYDVNGATTALDTTTQDSFDAAGLSYAPAH